MYFEIYKFAEEFLKTAAKWQEESDRTVKIKPPKKPKQDKTIFNLDTLKSINDFQRTSGYISGTLSPISAGSSRRVYDLGDKVLKMAFNDAGIAQNGLEARLQDQSPYFTKVYDMAPKAWWIISEKINPFNSSAGFEQYTGFPTTLLYNFAGERLTPEDLKLIQDEYGLSNESSKIFGDILNILLRFRLIGGDTLDPKHWGINNNGELKIYDYGLDKYIFESFKHIVNPKAWKKDQGLPVSESKPSASEEEEMANYKPEEESLQGGAMWI